MKKRNKTYVAIMAGALATIVAAGSVNAQIVQGYESFKRSVRNTIYADNATFDISMKVESEGKTLADEKTTLRIDKKNNKSQSTSYHYNRETGQMSTSESYVDQDMNIYTYEDQDGETQYNVYVNRNQNVNSNRQNMLEIPDEAVDILELSIDAFIGSAKDHFVKEDEGANSLITGNFDKTQVPAIGNAYISLILSQTGNYRYYNDGNTSYQPSADTLEGIIYYNKIEEGYINNVILDSSIDADGFFDSVDIKIQVMGKTKTGTEIPFDFSFTAKVSEKGTTTIVLPEINKDDENVSWNEYTDSPSVDYYAANQEVIDKYNEMMEKINNQMYTGVLTDEEKQNLLNALDAFDAALNGSDTDETIQTPSDSIEQDDASEQDDVSEQGDTLEQNDASNQGDTSEQDVSAEE